MFFGEVLRKFGGGRCGLKLIVDYILVLIRSLFVLIKVVLFEIRVKCIVEICMILLLVIINISL